MEYGQSEQKQESRRSDLSSKRKFNLVLVLIDFYSCLTLYNIGKQSVERFSSRENLRGSMKDQKAEIHHDFSDENLLPKSRSGSQVSKGILLIMNHLEAPMSSKRYTAQHQGNNSWSLESSKPQCESFFLNFKL